MALGAVSSPPLTLLPLQCSCFQSHSRGEGQGCVWHSQAGGTSPGVSVSQARGLPGGGVREGHPIRLEGPAQEMATGNTGWGGQWE